MRTPEAREETTEVVGVSTEVVDQPGRQAVISMTSAVTAAHSTPKAWDRGPVQSRHLPTELSASEGERDNVQPPPGHVSAISSFSSALAGPHDNKSAPSALTQEKSASCLGTDPSLVFSARVSSPSSMRDEKSRASNQGKRAKLSAAPTAQSEFGKNTDPSSSPTRATLDPDAPGIGDSQANVTVPSASLPTERVVDMMLTMKPGTTPAFIRDGGITTDDSNAQPRITEAEGIKPPPNGISKPQLREDDIVLEYTSTPSFPVTILEGIPVMQWSVPIVDLHSEPKLDEDMLSAVGIGIETASSTSQKTDPDSSNLGVIGSEGTITKEGKREPNQGASAGGGGVTYGATTHDTGGEQSRNPPLTSK
jgi:hypothetical protein